MHGGRRRGAGRRRGSHNRVLTPARYALRKFSVRKGTHLNVLYIVQIEPPSGPVKIGQAADVYLRWQQMLCDWPYIYPTEPLAIISGAAKHELEVLRRFAWACIHGEWHRPVPELLAFAERCQDLRALLIELHGPQLPLK